MSLRACREMLLALGVMVLAWALLSLTAGSSSFVAAILGVSAVLLFFSRRAVTRRLKAVPADTAKPTTKFFPRWLRVLLATFGRGFLILLYFSILGPVTYGFYAEPRAKQAARDFCAAIRIGEDADAVLERAKKTSALRSPAPYMRWDGPTAARRLTIAFAGSSPHSRHECVVEAGSAAVTGSRYTHAGD